MSDPWEWSMRLAFLAALCVIVLATSVTAVIERLAGERSVMRRVGIVLVLVGMFLGYTDPLPPWTSTIGAGVGLLGCYLVWRPPDDWWKRRRRSLGQVNIRVRTVLARGVPAKRPALAWEADPDE